MRNSLDKEVEKIETHILCSTTFLSESRAVYEKMLKNVVERDRSQMTIRRMRFTCWTTTFTRNDTRPLPPPTHGERNIHCFAHQLWFRERASALRYTHIASCLLHILNVATVLPLDAVRLLMASVTMLLY